MWQSHHLSLKATADPSQPAAAGSLSQTGNVSSPVDILQVSFFPLDFSLINADVAVLFCEISDDKWKIFLKTSGWCEGLTKRAPSPFNTVCVSKSCLIVAYISLTSVSATSICIWGGNTGSEETLLLLSFTVEGVWAITMTRTLNNNLLMFAGQLTLQWTDWTEAKSQWNEELFSSNLVKKWGIKYANKRESKFRNLKYLVAVSSVKLVPEKIEQSEELWRPKDYRKSLEDSRQTFTGIESLV